MHDWNVVVTVREGGFAQARRLLELLGPVGKTEFFNVLTMRVDDLRRALELLLAKIEAEPGILNSIARFVPMTHVFNFQSPEAFEERAREIVSQWVPTLADSSFHVRMRRRGFKGRLSSMEEERFLDEFLLDALDKAGTPGRVSFADPDYIIAVETIGTRAGFSLWSRGDMERYEFLGLD